MDAHQSLDDILVDKNDTKVDFEITKYQNLEDAAKGYKKLTDSINTKPKQLKINDTIAVSPSFLIQNIELAFQSWKQNPWSKNYDFNTFCEYILPYRSISEPLQDWRLTYKNIFEKEISKADDKSDPVALCSNLINSTKDYSFSYNRFCPKLLVGAKDMLVLKQGSCQDLANLMIYASRAIGIATTYDFTPHYAASSNRHYWNTVIDNKGKHIPFNGNQNLPNEYTPTTRRLGKVFRVTFSNQKQSLANLISREEIPDGFLTDKNILDVTSEYVKVSNLNYTFQNTSAKIGYLNVFNRGTWRTLDWSKITNNKVVYNNMGRNIVYLPSIFTNKKTVYENFPIVLNPNGTQTILQPDFKDTFTAEIIHKGNAQNIGARDNNSLHILINEKYNLYVFNKGNWEFIEQQTCNIGDVITFNKIPKNGLFLMIPMKPDYFERIFTINPVTKTISWY
jgi:hypothetical protein